MPISGQGWELHVNRVSEQTKNGKSRTVGTYQVHHNGAPVTHTIKVDGVDVPLSGTTAESRGPSQNDAPATSANPSRIVAKNYRLAISGGPTYLTRNYRQDERIADGMPGIELLDTRNRTDILIHPGKDEFLSSIGCINLCTRLPDADEIINYRGSRRRVIALIEDMRQFLGPLPTADKAPIPGASIVVDEHALVAAQPPMPQPTAPAPTGNANGFGWPLARNIIRRGMNNHTFGMVRNGGKRAHQGWDFEALPGTPCFAICDGKIALVYEDPIGFGKVAVLAFPFEGGTRYAAYAHLSAINVHTGQTVTKGQRIGLTGNTGNARGMKGADQHLHFEIRKIPRPGKGLDNRESPMDVFGHCPLHAPVP